jgi:competence protein ComFC
MNLKRPGSVLGETTLDIFFPKQCFGCRVTLGRKEADVLCEKCFKAIHIFSLFFCPDCGKRLPECTKLCRCGAAFIAAAPCLYGSEPLTEIVQVLKYKGIRDGAKTLGKVLTLWAKASALEPASFVIMPIPLSNRRRRERGFNQSERIAENFLYYWNDPTLRVATGLLERSRHTTPQTELHSYAERAENVKDAFRIMNTDAIKNKIVLLIDDVMTSGSTMREAVKVLRTNGAKRVIGLTVLRA